MCIPQHPQCQTPSLYIFRRFAAKIVKGWGLTLRNLIFT